MQSRRRCASCRQYILSLKNALYCRDCCAQYHSACWQKTKSCSVAQCGGILYYVFLLPSLLHQTSNYRRAHGLPLNKTLLPALQTAWKNSLAGEIIEAELRLQRNLFYAIAKITLAMCGITGFVCLLLLSLPDAFTGAFTFLLLAVPGITILFASTAAGRLTGPIEGKKSSPAKTQTLHGLLSLFLSFLLSLPFIFLALLFVDVKLLAEAGADAKRFFFLFTTSGDQSAFLALLNLHIVAFAVSCGYRNSLIPALLAMFFGFVDLLLMSTAARLFFLNVYPFEIDWTPFLQWLAFKQHVAWMTSLVAVWLFLRFRDRKKRIDLRTKLVIGLLLTLGILFTAIKIVALLLQLAAKPPVL